MSLCEQAAHKSSSQQGLKSVRYTVATRATQ